MVKWLVMVAKIATVVFLATIPDGPLLTLAKQYVPHTKIS